MVGPDEARQLHPGASVGWPQHDDLGAGVGDAADRVQELALNEHPALDLEAEPDEEGRHRVEVRDGDADMFSSSYVQPGGHPPIVVLVDPLKATSTGPNSAVRNAPLSAGDHTASDSATLTADGSTQ